MLETKLMQSSRSRGSKAPPLVHISALLVEARGICLVYADVRLESPQRPAVAFYTKISYKLTTDNAFRLCISFETELQEKRSISIV